MEAGEGKRRQEQQPWHGSRVIVMRGWRWEPKAGSMHPS